MATKQTKKKKNLTPVYSGLVYIQSSFNNTIVTIADETGNVIAWASSGSIGFKGSKKSTPYAASLATSAAIEKAKIRGLKKVQIFISGVGSGRDSAVRAFQNANIDVEIIKDITPVPHNGCRRKKVRRV
ncbi:MAG: small subunit ribosomal protein S11 [Candidatus Berkelbacteria bacterium Athens1014_28]|uniref:Small ribosomal subunit protein uS11 n=1 Tax=Candidatus Berkelbacteria bacterium Athens1014_28 TaxID=2017145 RepID=A0A554LR09_9BACT|nr:MAG: small subunit ribosomal protein S11 [Candidatus Berkelbacteria bacterium Athens1014_28]